MELKLKEMGTNVNFNNYYLMNSRYRLKFTDKKGVEVCGDILCCRSLYYIATDFSFKNSVGWRDYKTSEIRDFVMKNDLDYTEKGLLALINHLASEQYTKIIIES